MSRQDGTVSAQPDGLATMNNHLSDSAPAATTPVPHDRASGEATEGRTAMALDMTGRGQQDTTEGRTMTGDVDMQPQVMDCTATDSSGMTNNDQLRATITPSSRGHNRNKPTTRRTPKTVKT